MNYKKLAALGLATTMFATACTDDDPGEARQVDDIVLTSGLVTFDSCEALLEEIKTEALEQVGPYGFGGGEFRGIAEPMIMEDFALESGDEATASDSSADFSPATTQAGDGSAKRSSSEFSTTNNQEVNVDEADIVKTNGEYLLVAQGDTLHVIDVSANEVKHSIDLPENSYSSELFLDGDTAVLMSRTEFYGDPVAFEEDVDIARSSFFAAGSTTLLTAIDIEAGEVTSSKALTGEYLQARMVDGTIRVVLSQPESRLDFVFPSSGSERAERIAEEANRNIINESVIGDWIPENPDDSFVVDCERLSVPTKFAGFGIVSVLTLDIGSSIDVLDTTGVMTDGREIYASTDRLVVSTPEWVERSALAETLGLDSQYRTAIHSFDISDPAKTEYVASGSVPGTILNRLAFSQHDGHLRVATTEGNPWGARSSESLVTVLREDDGKLVAVGQVDDIGRGERITAVRFFGDIAYVVTFRQTDPFYTVDLSDPTNPEVLGELKIPGFSSYLHPISDDLVFAVGEDGDEEASNGIAVASIFDVSDLSDPRLVDKVRLTEGRSFATVAQDSRAFTLWDDVAYIPVDAWEQQSEGGVIAVNVGRDLQLKGKISHSTVDECDTSFYDEELEAIRRSENLDETAIAELEAELEDAAIAECFSYTPSISRTVVIDDALYTVSETGVGVNDLDSLDPISWISY